MDDYTRGALNDRKIRNIDGEVRQTISKQSRFKDFDTLGTAILINLLAILYYI